MAQWSNNKFFVLLLAVLFSNMALAQQQSPTPEYKDYRDPERFEKFRRRSIIVGAWQINTLKEEGALVVRLKTNKLLIDQLIKQGNQELATEKQLEQYAVNKNTMFAFLDYFTFCKVYFIFSNSSDSLMSGTREGIFLDTTLRVNPAIKMTEKFYLLAERDYVYTSSIGFVKEDSARYMKEEGNPIKQMAFVIKNKYGHQLKKPFPFAVKEKSFSGITYNFPLKYESTPSGLVVMYAVNKTFLSTIKTTPDVKKFRLQEGNVISTTVGIKREFLYERLSVNVVELNDEMERFYKNYPKPDIKRIHPEVIQFLY